MAHRTHNGNGNKNDNNPNPQIHYLLFSVTIVTIIYI